VNVARADNPAALRRNRTEMTSTGAETVLADAARVGGRPPSGAAQIRALAVANLRFWSGVAADCRGELARWRRQAAQIDQDDLRRLAETKLAEEAFNAEVAATLATLAPRGRRATVVKAIVALEVLFDYLDGRTEALFERRHSPGAPEPERDAPEPGADGQSDAHGALDEGMRLSETLRAVIDGEAPALGGADSAYLNALWGYAHRHAAQLPSLRAITPAALGAASRCAEAQLRLHAAAVLGDGQLRSWAQRACSDSGLGWREYVGASASSVLAMHALIATAAQPGVGQADAQALDGTYLRIAAVITTLDSLVDERRDRRAGHPGYVRLYEDRQEIQQRLLALVSQALARAGQLPDGAHHAMTLAGVAAYYTTHPGGADPANRAIRRAVRRALAPAIWPALAVLRSWRGAKRTHRALNSAARWRSAPGRAKRRAPHARRLR
jgi:tetraprenyl-beta-curcumene synthase